MSAPAPDSSPVGLKILPDDVETLLPVESSASLSGGITLTNNDSHRTSPYLNNKIRNICLILSVMVVFNHSRTLDMEYGWDGIVVEPMTHAEFVDAPFGAVIQHFLSGALGRITNPFFFMASGFLFFFAWRPSMKSWFGKMRKRVYTLLLPYLVWSFIGMGMSYLVYLADNLDRLRGVSETPTLTFFDAAVYFFNMRVPPQLWFLRALMILMLCTPLLALVICALKRYALLLILAVYFSGFETPWGELSKSAICFFSIGAVLGYLRHDLTLPKRWVQWSLFALWISLAAVYSGLSLFIQADYTILFHCLVLSGISGIWGLYDLLPMATLDWLSRYSPYRFFIYMASEPLSTILRYRYFETFQSTQWVDLIQYLGLSLFVVLLCGGVAYILRRRVEGFYLFLSGGR